MVNVEQAIMDPSHFFNRPTDIVRDNSLTRDDKILILRSWAYDEREMAVAEEENMLGLDSDKENILDEILKSLHELGANADQTQSPPTKQG